jgi:glycerol transport system ATP-binding protein
LSPNGAGVEVDGEVKIAEISGSESIVRVIVEGNNWVSETHGIHSYEFGQSTSFFFDSSRCLYFDANEMLIETQL